MRAWRLDRRYDSFPQNTAFLVGEILDGLRRRRPRLRKIKKAPLPPLKRLEDMLRRIRSYFPWVYEYLNEEPAQAAFDRINSKDSTKWDAAFDQIAHAIHQALLELIS